MSNRFGLDASYFKDKLGQLVRDANNYTPQEMARALARYSIVADSSVIHEQEFVSDEITRLKERVKGLDKSRAKIRQEVYKGDALMQYTGLKDRNGVEIYEGDIVKAPYWNVQKIYGEVRYFGMDEVSSLFDGQYRLCLTDGRNFDMKFSEEMEVIGNIYENPGLLCKT